MLCCLIIYIPEQIQCYLEKIPQKNRSPCQEIEYLKIPMDLTVHLLDGYLTTMSNRWVLGLVVWNLKGRQQQTGVYPV